MFQQAPVKRSNSISNNSNRKPLNSPSSGPSNSKLHQYFGSSEYLSQQEELSMFISDFPIISLESIKSINQILPLLIKQNEMLANKTQQQVSLMKESFLKHEQLSRQARDSKREMEQLKVVYDQKLAELEQREKLFEKQSQQIVANLSSFDRLVLTLNTTIKLLIESEYKKCEDLVNSRDTRLLFQDFETDRRKLEALFNQCKDSNVENSGDKHEDLANLALIQKHCKAMRKKTKHLSKIKPSVEDFCSRLKRILQVVPAEQLIQEFSFEADQFIQIVGELVGERQSSLEASKRRAESSSSNPNIRRYHSNKKDNEERNLSSVGSESSLGLGPSSFTHNQNLNHQLSQGSHYFEQLLMKLNNKSEETLRATSSELHATISKLQKQLAESREYYETYLINLKMEHEKQKRSIQEELAVQTETKKHYEERVQESITEIQSFKNRVEVLEMQNQTLKDSNSPLLKEIEALKKNETEQLEKLQAQRAKASQQILQAQSSFKQRQENFNQNLEREKQSKKKQQAQFQENVEKLKKKYSVLEQQSEDLQREKKTLKSLLADKEEDIRRLSTRIQTIEQQRVAQLVEQLEVIEKDHKKQKQQLKALQKQNNELLQEQKLRQAYIKELELKLTKSEQSAKKLTEKLSHENLSKSKREASERKSLEKQLKEAYKLLNKEKEQSTRLRSLIKEMKRELEEVYLTLNDLKQIEGDRERLIIESEKSERWKKQIMADYDEMKYEILKVETQNKHLALEVKHYKRMVEKIEALN